MHLCLLFLYGKWACAVFQTDGNCASLSERLKSLVRGAQIASDAAVYILL